LSTIHALASLLAIIPLSAAPAQNDGGEEDAAKLLHVAQLPAPEAAEKRERWGSTRAAFEEVAGAAERSAAEKSPLTLGRIYRLWNLNNLVEAPKRVKKALEAVLAQPKLDPLTRAHTEALLAELLLREGDMAGAKKRIDQIGLVTSAWMIGPFENSAGQGHDEAYSPESGPRLDEPLEGKSHAVRWREVSGLADRGVFELSSLFHPSSEATAYLLVTVDAKRPTVAALRTGSTDQLKVFLDGGEVFGLDTRRSANLDQDAIPLQLSQGKSALMIKSSWTGASGRLMFRLTAPDGGLLDGVAIQSDRASLEEALQSAKKRGAKKIAKPTIKVAAVPDAIDKVIKTAKGKELAEALALRADLYAIVGLFDRRKLPTQPEQDLFRAIELSPSNPMMRFFYAHRVQERDPTLAREQLESTLVSDPDFVPALFKLGEMAKASGRFIEAEARLADAAKRDPDFLPARVSLATLRFEVDADRDVALFDLTELAERSPSSMVLQESARMHRALENRPQARRDAERALAADFSDQNARSLLIGIELDAAEIDAAMKELDAEIAFAPWQLASRLKKARLLAGMPNQIDASLAVLAEAARAFPDNPEVPNLESEVELVAGNKQRALAALDRSLELDPQQTEVRRHRGKIAGTRLELEDEYTVDAKGLMKTAITAEENTWGAIYLADRTAIRLYENGQTSRFLQSVIRLRNANMKDALRYHQVPYAPGREFVEILSAERIRPSGEIIKASNISDNGPQGKVSGMYVDRRFKTITFDDMAAGDVVNVRYRIDSLGQNIFGNFFGDMAYLQGPLPKLGVLYTVIAPRSRPLYAGEIHAPAPVVIEDASAGTVKTTLAMEKIDAIDLEPYTPPYPEIGMVVSLSTYKNWADLGRWYANLFSEQLELDDAARTAGKKAIAGAKTDKEKITRLYDFVVQNTRYVGIELGIHGWKPFKAAEVLRRRYGDCKDKATLLAALLRDNGIDATVTLVRTSDKGTIPPDHATMWAFNHAITYVPSEDLFLDGTAEFSGSRELPFLDQGATALIVQPDGKTKLVTLPESKAQENVNSSNYIATITREGALELQGTERFFGARASPLRQEFEEQEQRKSRLEKQLNQVFTGVHIKELSFSDLSNLEIPVEYKYQASIERYGVVENGRYIIPVALFQHQVASAYGSLATRKTDLFGNHTWSTRNVVRYKFPKGAAIETLPESLKIDTTHIALEQSVREVPGGFETDDTVTLKSRRIPAVDYPEFRRACLAIDRALERSVVIKW
jgi:tetratricopeptide (TPR) repeat protein